MNIAKFKEDYYSKSVLDTYEQIKEIFENDLTDEFIENFSAIDMILDTQGFHVSNKDFDKAIEFTKIVRNKQPELYKQYFYYIENFLVNYYCLNSIKDEMHSIFNNFIKYQEKNILFFDKTIKQLLFYGYTDIIGNISFDDIETPKSNEKQNLLTSYTISKIKYYMVLEEIYENFKENNLIDWTKYIRKFNQIGFKFDETHTSILNQGLTENSFITKSLLFKLEKNLEKTLVVIGLQFIKYMKSLGFSFAISGRLWDEMEILWKILYKKQTNSLKTFFNINKESFQTHVLVNSLFAEFEKPLESIFLTWGSRYVYDFLKNNEIIDQDIYNTFSDIQFVLMGRIINNFNNDLWESNFIQKYNKPESISQEEMNAFKNIFSKTYSYKSNSIDDFFNLIKDDLNILNKNVSEGFNITNSLFSEEFVRNLDNEKNNNINQNEIITNKKVGRNDPCTCGSGKKYKKCCGK